MTNVSEELSPAMMREIVSFTLGEELGDGMSRRVFVYNGNPDYVIKVEVGNEYQNAIEWSTWEDVKNGPLQGYFSPCKRISAYGAILLMERTWTPPHHYKWPNTFPALFTDFKRSNFGLNKKGRLVCHDYGTNLAMYNSGFNARKKKAGWWD